MTNLSKFESETKNLVETLKLDNLNEYYESLINENSKLVNSMNAEYSYFGPKVLICLIFVGFANQG